MSEMSKTPMPPGTNIGSEVSQYPNTEKRIVYQPPLNKRDFTVTPTSFETLQFAIPRNGLLDLKNSYFHVPNVTFGGTVARNVVFDLTAGHLQLFNRITLYGNNGSQIINIENAHQYHSVKGCLIDQNDRRNKLLLAGGGIAGTSVNARTNAIANGATYESTNKKKYTITICLWDILFSMSCNSDLSQYFATTSLDSEMRLELQLNNLNTGCVHNGVDSLSLNDTELRLAYTQYAELENKYLNSSLNFIVPNVKHYIDSVVLPAGAVRTDFNISFRSPYSSLSAVYVTFQQDHSGSSGFNSCNSNLPGYFGLNLSLAGQNIPMLQITDEKVLYAEFIKCNNGIGSSYSQSKTTSSTSSAAMDGSNAIVDDQLDQKCIFGMDMRQWQSKEKSNRFNGSNIVAQEFSLNGFFNITSDYVAGWADKTLQANIFLVYDQQVMIEGGNISTRF